MKKLDVERVGRSLKTTCARCGGAAWVDVGNRDHNAYCGEECRKAAMSELNNKQIAIACPQCGKINNFAPSRVKRGNKFCSQSCYTAYQKSYPHGGKGKDAKPRTRAVCKVCKKEYTHLFGRGNSGCCSKRCLMALTGVTKTCPRCGRIFRVPRSNASRYVFCSLECARAETVYKNCLRCGKVFRVDTENRKHCSEECRRPPVLNACLTCGKTFRVVPSMAYQKYCSPQCYRRYSGETEPEKNVRLCLEYLNIRYTQEHVFKGWKYPVDFFLPDYDVVIEVDGEYWHRKQSVKDRDRRKKEWIEARGYKVFRIGDAPFYGKVSEDMITILASTINH